MSSGVWELTAEAGKRFLVHEGILASQSQRLRDIIDAFTAAEPSPKREIPLDNWDADTVGRLVEYVYTGDYQSPDPQAPSTPSFTPTESVQDANNSRESSEEASTQGQDEEEEDSIPAPPARPLTPLSECFAPGPDPDQKLSAADEFAEKYFDPSEHDFEEVFLAHAKIFALAQEFEMHDLQTLAVQRLLRTFINIDFFQPDWPVASNFVELARYTYGGNNHANNDLRHVVSQFAALNFTTLQTDEMKALIEESGRFARDLTAKVCRRLIIAEKTHNSERKELKELKLQMHAMKAELDEELEKVVGKSASPTRSINPLDRKPSSNGSAFSYSRKSGSGIFAKIPPPPPNRIFPGTNTFGTITASTRPLTIPTISTNTNIFDTPGHPTIVSSFSHPKQSPARSSPYTSSSPGAKSIFVKTEIPTGTTGLFPEPAKSIFETNKTPTKSSSSFGLFNTPPQSRSTSALGMAKPAEPVSLFPDPVKQPTPSSNIFTSSGQSNSTSAFGMVKQTPAAGSLFGGVKVAPPPLFSAKTSTVTPIFGDKPAPVAPLFGQNVAVPTGTLSFGGGSIFGKK